MTQWPNLWPTLSAPLTNPALRFIASGMGVQSTTLLLAAARGDVRPMPDCAIFADTRWEPKRVMEHIERIRPLLPFPLHTITRGDLRAAAIEGEEPEDRFAVPFHVRRADGKLTIGKRQCTSRYKIVPIKHKVREILGVGPRGYLAPDSVEQWIGISTDEAHRMAPSGVAYIRNRHPLIEADMTREGCKRWLAERQQRAVKSRCRGCPFQTNDDWRDLRDSDPEEWAQTIAEDRAIRSRGSSPDAQQFMHFSGVPLEEANLEAKVHPNQLGFDLHCGGACGS